jgi:hypothetical protein
MTARPILVSLVLLCSSACDGESEAPKDAAPAKPVAESKAGAPSEAEAADAQGANPPPAMKANPHGGMAGMKAATPDEAGPPRDVDPSGETTSEAFAELKVEVPKEWEKGQPSNAMRVAEFSIPGPGGDAELVVYRFAGGAGGVEANVERWKGQFQPPQGKTMDDLTTLKTMDVGDLDVTHVDISGRYVAAVRPGAPQTVDKPDQRMLAAIVEGSGDPFFLKATGPAKTLDVWAEAFTRMVESAKKS